MPTDGGPGRRLTYWGDKFATVRGWVSGNEVLVLSRAGQHDSMQTWAFAVPLNGPARRLDYGPTGDVTVRDGAVLVGSALEAHVYDPAQWKGYRGGTGWQNLVLAGRLALHPDPRRRGHPFGEPHVRRAPGRVPLRPRRDRRAVFRAPGRHGPAPSHRPRPVLRPARDDRRPARGLPAGRGDLAARVARRRAGAAGHTARHRPLRALPLPGVGEVGAGFVRAGCHRPGAGRGGARYRALAAQPGRGGPGAARRAGRARPACGGHPRRGRGCLRVRQRRRGRSGRDPR